MKSIQRAWLLVASVCCLALLAGVLAVRSFATLTYYCDACTLSSDGVPAVSEAHTTFNNNYMATFYYSNSNYAEQVYYYNAPQNQLFCVGTAYGQYIYVTNCGTGGVSATARCHFVQGYGPGRANCSAEYS
jgi:hypothetical protein